MEIWDKIEDITNYNADFLTWGSWLSASAPYVIAPVETIVVLYKKSWKKLHKGISDMAKSQLLSVQMDCGLFQVKAKITGHPAPLPLESPEECFKQFSYVGGTVLDTYLGIGTTVITANNLSRKAISVEIDKKYFQLAINRIS